MTFDEIFKLDKMLTEANIPHTFKSLFDGYQIRMYADETQIRELDDCVCHSGSFGSASGLLETYLLHECSGFETAKQVFKGWKKMYQKAQQNY